MTGLVFQMLVVVIKIIEVLLCSKYSSKLLTPEQLYQLEDDHPHLPTGKFIL